VGMHTIVDILLRIVCSN